MNSIPNTPAGIVWDITYACPLRCIHCYSESGRRPTKELSYQDKLRVVDALISLRPRNIALSGGEPLGVKGIFEIAQRISGAGINVSIYTSGWSLPDTYLEPLLRTFDRVTLSLDGASAAVHDRIRGRVGSFDRAIHTAGILDNAIAQRRQSNARCSWWGIDCVVVRSNIDGVAAMAGELPARFPRLNFMSFGAVIPSGLATSARFCETQLLTEQQVARLTDRAFTEDLQELAGSVEISTTNNNLLKMHPESVKQGVFPGLQVEPDGAVRAMAIYEGTVGSLLDEPAQVLWERATARWNDPFVVNLIGPATTRVQWATAARALDWHFGSTDVRDRISRRPGGQS